MIVRLAIVAILLGLVLLKAATAQLTMVGFGAGGYGGGGGGGGSLTWTAVANPTPITGGGLTSPMVFSGVNFGAADSTRVLVACLAWEGAVGDSRADVSAVSIGGVSASLAADLYPTTQRGNAIW